MAAAKPVVLQFPVHFQGLPGIAQRLGGMVWSCFKITVGGFKECFEEQSQAHEIAATGIVKMSAISAGKRQKPVGLDHHFHQ